MTAFTVLAFAMTSAPRRLSAEGGAARSAPSGEAKEKTAQERSLDLQRKAVAAHRDKRVAEAVDLLTEAWNLTPDHLILCARGDYLDEMGRSKEAAEDFSACLRMMSKKETALLGKKAERELEKIRARIGTITVETNVPGAEIVVDGTVVGTAPLPGPIFVEPGERGIEVKAPGYDSAVRLVVIPAGAWYTLRLNPEAMSPTEAKGGAAQSPTLLPPSSPQGMPSATAVAAAPSLSSLGPAALDEQKAGASPRDGSGNVALVASGIGLAALGTGLGIANLVTAARERAKGDEIFRDLVLARGTTVCTDDVHYFDCQAVRSASAHYEVFTGLAVGSFVLAAAGGAIAVLGLIRSSETSKSVATSVVVAPMRDGGSIVAAGRF